MSDSTAGLTTSVPVAFATAVTVPTIVTMCVARWALSVSNVIELMDPPGERLRSEYAPAARLTGSLYVMVMRSAAVMLKEVAVGRWPSASASEVIAGRSVLPAASFRDAGATVRVPEASVPTALPSNVTLWESRGVPLAGPVSMRDVSPDPRSRAAYADAPGSTGSV